MNCLSVFDHFVGLALKGLINFKLDKKLKLKTLTRIIYSKKEAILPSCVRYYVLRFAIQISLNNLVVDYISYD